MPARTKAERERRKGNIGAAATLVFPLLILFTIPLGVPLIPFTLLVIGTLTVMFMHFRAGAEARRKNSGAT